MVVSSKPSCGIPPAGEAGARSGTSRRPEGGRRRVGRRRPAKERLARPRHDFKRLRGALRVRRVRQVTGQGERWGAPFARGAVGPSGGEHNPQGHNGQAAAAVGPPAGRALRRA